MESKRQQKLSRLIQKDLGDIFIKEASNILPGKFLSPSVVKITPDLSLARVYFSLMLEKNPQEVVDVLNENKKQIKNLLAQKIKNQVRKIPELEFYYDDSEAEANKINDIINRLDIPEESKDDLNEDHDNNE